MSLLKSLPIFIIFAIHSSIFAGGFPILFTKQKNNSDNIYLITEKGELLPITDHPRKDSSPVVSADGRMIVFTSERVGWWKIWRMDIPDQKFRQLSDSPSAEYAPFWSPSGERIVFVSSRDGNAEIYVMNADGSGLANISNYRGTDSMPFWAADGSIYYSSEMDGVFQIVRCKSDGSGREILSATGGNKFMPQLSPDGQKILFYGDKDGNPEIYTQDLTTQKLQRLTNDPLMDIRPRWSPDGQHIVFENGDKQKNQHIFIMDADGGNKKRLTTRDYNYAPSFVANCQYLCLK